LILFLLLSLIAIGSALAVVLHPNPIYSALALVVTLVQVAVMFVLLHAGLLAFLQVIVYAGAIVVLFLFVIMLLSLEPDVPHPGRWGIRSISLITAALLGVELAAIGPFYGSGSSAAVPEGFGSTEALAEQLFSTSLLPFELTSVLLLVAIVGAVVMARRKV
jgi:NADH-quinone oxidoreductase subunit J